MKKHFFRALVLSSSLLSLCQAQLPLLQTENTYFIQATTGQKIVLKGIGISNNVWGFYEWPKSDSLEKAKVNPLIRAREMKPFVFTSEDIERLSQLKGNVVRYCINDELFRTDNAKRQSNLALMRSHIAQLADKGFYSIVTMQISPGLDNQNEMFDRNKPPYARLQSPFESDSVFRLWCDTWQFIAKGLEDVDAVAGYELISEPRRPALADASEQQLVKTYVKLIDSIRSVDPRHIVMVPEYNSREANPGEEYWSEALGQMVTDKGEQGIIWGRNWLQLPRTLANLVYISHLYAPFEFTTAKTATTFNVIALQKEVQESANWVYAQNKPLYISEYGVNYFHTMRGNDAKRIEWLKIMHDAFDSHHISATVFQYKDLITPWVKMEETFGLWQHYYDLNTVKGIMNGKIEYSDEATKTAAITSKIDPILHQYFIEEGKLKSISMVGNQTLMDELNRYFGSLPLGEGEWPMTPITHQLYADKDYLYFKGLPLSLTHTQVSIVTLEGRQLLDTTLSVQEGKTQLLISKLNKQGVKLLLVKYGTKGEWSQKVILP